MRISKKDTKKKTGPEPELLKINLEFEDAVRRSFKAKRPKEGWPKRKNHRKDQQEDKE